MTKIHNKISFKNCSRVVKNHQNVVSFIGFSKSFSIFQNSKIILFFCGNFQNLQMKNISKPRNEFEIHQNFQKIAECKNFSKPTNDIISKNFLIPQIKKFEKILFRIIEKWKSFEKLTNKKNRKNNNSRKTKWTWKNLSCHLLRKNLRNIAPQKIDQIHSSSKFHNQTFQSDFT